MCHVFILFVNAVDLTICTDIKFCLQKDAMPEQCLYYVLSSSSLLLFHFVIEQFSMRLNTCVCVCVDSAIINFRTIGNTYE